MYTARRARRSATVRMQHYETPEYLHDPLVYAPRTVHTPRVVHSKIDYGYGYARSRIDTGLHSRNKYERAYYNGYTTANPRVSYVSPGKGHIEYVHTDKFGRISHVSPGKGHV